MYSTIQHSTILHYGILYNRLSCLYSMLAKCCTDLSLHMGVTLDTLFFAGYGRAYLILDYWFNRVWRKKEVSNVQMCDYWRKKIDKSALGPVKHIDGVYSGELFTAFALKQS